VLIVVCDVHLGHLESPELATAETSIKHALWGSPDGSSTGIGIHLDVETREDGFSELLALDPQLLSVAKDLFKMVRLQYGTDTQTAAIRELQLKLDHSERERERAEREREREREHAERERGLAQQTISALEKANNSLEMVLAVVNK
jgi:hypothetical protein